ncbi:UNVERIFIED_CONTAM: hypothetical protein Scaly_1971000 [Sesamum calycinum]|uniref:RNase H type-1 domain-containing protein n=1 Tax=Sesamum calycinum TaxID=2727403 RepID=A0AAW2MZN5_9LAMI
MVAREILTVLDIYRRASRQEINFAKSSVAFSRNTKEEVRQTTAGTLCIRRENKMELYLGLPSKVLARRRISLALFEIESGGVFQGGMRSYSPKKDSRDGGQILVGEQGNRKIHWLSWDRLCDSKLKGGLGFRQLSLFNIAIDIFSASSGWRPSFTWRSLMVAQSLFRAGCRWRVGSGSSIRVWNDPWLPQPISFKPITPPPPSSMNLRVLDFIDSSLGDWDRAKIDEIFWPEDKEACCNALSTSSNLAKRLSGVSSVCPHCKEDDEDTFHVLVGCHFARQVWGLANFNACILPRERLAILTNSKFMTGECLDTIQAAVLLENILNRFSPKMRTLLWGSAMGIGVVARDLNGVCLAWLSRKVLRTGNGEIAEALAAREAIQLAARRGWKSIIIEWDCAVLISKLRAVDHDLSYIGTVIFDILSFVNLFTSCQFACVKRAFNSVAHCLAKSAVGMLEGVDDLPSSALDIVISEFC